MQVIRYSVNLFTCSDVKEYCQDESFTANCPSNQVILMESARYGRMKIGRCVQQSLGYLGCIKDVLRFLDARCSGQQNCELTMMDTNLREFMPCPKDVTWHLEASYRCVDGELDCPILLIQWEGYYNLYFLSPAPHWVIFPIWKTTLDRVKIQIMLKTSQNTKRDWGLILFCGPHSSQMFTSPNKLSRSVGCSFFFALSYFLWNWSTLFHASVWSYRRTQATYFPNRTDLQFQLSRKFSEIRQNSTSPNI